MAHAPLLIRPEQSEDIAAVRQVNIAAFGRNAEADLVDLLRAHGRAAVSLVALVQDSIVGHILFSQVAIKGADLRALGLAPMAVLPQRQRSGIGVQLVARGLAACREQGWDAVVVLGHPAYYPRFGFVRASRFGLRSEYDAPDEAFMALELRPGALQQHQGLVRYAPEFSGV